LIKIQRARRRRGGGFCIISLPSSHEPLHLAVFFPRTERLILPKEQVHVRIIDTAVVCVCPRSRNVHVILFFSPLYNIIFSYSRRKCSLPAVAVATTVAVVDAADRGCTSAMSYRRPEATHDDRIGAKATDLHAGDW